MNVQNLSTKHLWSSAPCGISLNHLVVLPSQVGSWRVRDRFLQVLICGRGGWFLFPLHAVFRSLSVISSTLIIVSTWQLGTPRRHVPRDKIWSFQAGNWKMAPLFSLGQGNYRACLDSGGGFVDPPLHGKKASEFVALFNLLHVPSKNSPGKYPPKYLLFSTGICT